MATTQPDELNRILQSAADRRASDVHLLPGEPVCYRVGVAGEIERADGPPLSANEIARLADAVIGKHRLAADLAETGRSFASVSLTGTVHGKLVAATAGGVLTIAIRMLMDHVPSVETVRLPPAVVAMADAPNGLVLFCGPSGSGKNTSAVSLVDHVNATKSRFVCTVEDPIGYPLIPKRSIVRQGEVGVDFPDRATGIAVTLRLDPDVIYVDQLQTLTDITTLVTAAQTGHLAVSVMHAHSPVEAVRTLVDVQPADGRPLFRRRLAEVLRVVVSQVLLPWAGGKGRVAAYGVMPVDDEMRRAIADGRDVLQRRMPMPDGYVTLTRAIERLRDDGSISDETARRAIEDRRALGPIEE